jgi:hypothetical protein
VALCFRDRAAMARSVAEATGTVFCRFFPLVFDRPATDRVFLGMSKSIHPVQSGCIALGTTVLTNVRFVARSMGTFRSDPSRLRRVPIAT